MRKRIKIFLCVLLACTMCVANTSYSLADQIDEYSFESIANTYEEENNLENPLNEIKTEDSNQYEGEIKQELITESVEGTYDSEENTEIKNNQGLEENFILDEISEKNTSDEEIQDKNTTEQITDDKQEAEESALKSGLDDDNHSSIMQYCHVPVDYTDVINQYVSETNKEVVVKKGDVENTYYGSDIYIDLSQTDENDLDKYIIEFILNYHMNETDIIEPESRTIQEGDYFFVNVPKYMEPHLAEGNTLNLKFEQNGDETIIAIAEIVSFQKDDYKIKITFTDAVGVNEKKSWFNINFGCKFWVTINKEKIHESVEKRETIDVSGINIDIKYPEKSYEIPSEINKSGVFDKNNNTIFWTITVDKNSVSKSLNGWTLTDVMDVSNQTIKAISLKTYNESEKKVVYDINDNFKDDNLVLKKTDEEEIYGFEYLFKDGDKSPCCVYIETEPKNDVVISHIMDMNDVVFQNQSVSLSKENNVVLAEPAYVTYKFGKSIIKKGVATNAANIKWTIILNEDKNNILGKVNVTDVLDKDLELIDGSVKFDYYNILDKTDKENVFAKNEKAYYTINKSDVSDTLIVWLNDDVLSKTSHVIEFETKLKLDEESYVQNQREVENSATLNTDKYGKSQTDTTKATYNKETGIHYYEIKKTGRFNSYDLTILWKLQPSTVATNDMVLKRVKIVDTIDLRSNGEQNDFQKFDESSLKFYVGGIERDNKELGITYIYDEKTKKIVFDFADTTLDIEKFNKLEISYKTVLTNVATKSVTMKKKTNFNYQIYSYNNDVVIKDDNYESHSNSSVLASSHMVDKITEAYHEDEEIGFKYTIKVNPYKYPVNGGITITDDLNSIEYKYFDSKTNKEIKSNEIVKPIFELEKVVLYRDKKIVDDIEYSVTDNLFSVNLEPEIVSHNIVDVVLYLKIANKNEFFKQNIAVSPINTVKAQIKMNNPNEISSEVTFIDDTGVKLTQKLIEKAFDNQEFDALTGDTFANYSVTINQKAVALGDVKIIDVLQKADAGYVLDSIRLYRLEQTSVGEVIDSKPIEVSDFTKTIDYDENGLPRLTIGITNCKDSYKLVYKVKVSGKQEIVSLTNNVKLEGKSISGEVTDVIKNDITIGQNGWADAKQKAVVKILKKDADTKNVLQGVSFGLYKRNQPGVLVSEKITDKNGCIVFYVEFETDYIIKETKALEGYVAETKEYIINQGDLVQGTKEEITIEIENKKIPKTEEPKKEIPSEEVPKNDIPNNTPNNSNSTPTNNVSIMDENIPLISTIPEESKESIIVENINDEDVPLISNIKTGDDGSIGWLFIVMIISVIMFFGATILMNKEKENEE